MARTKAELAEAIRKADPSLGCASRMAEMTSCDYDEIAQRLTDTYAEWLGISEPSEDEMWADDYEESEYYLVNEIANEHLAEWLTEDEDDEDAMMAEWYDYVGDDLADIMPWHDRYADDVRALIAEGLSIEEAIAVVADAN